MSPTTWPSPRSVHAAAQLCHATTERTSTQPQYLHDAKRRLVLVKQQTVAGRSDRSRESVRREKIEVSPTAWRAHNVHAAAQLFDAAKERTATQSESLHDAKRRLVFVKQQAVAGSSDRSRESVRREKTKVKHYVRVRWNFRTRYTLQRHL